MQTDAASALADLGALSQRVVDAFDAVGLHGEQEAAGELRTARTRIKQSRWGVSEPEEEKDIPDRSS